MFSQEILVYLILISVLALFVWGRWRYDLVALGALLATTLLGLVPMDKAFEGFGHPSVITVAAVLVVSKGLMNSGLVDVMVHWVSRGGDHPRRQLAALVIGVTFFSGFMNNIGALALFMPVAIQMARKSERSPSMFLMPLAFGSLLGGLMTQVGTPPNIIISAIRKESSIGVPFRMFDFFPVGAAVALAGIVFIILFAWVLMPQRQGRVSREELFEIKDYITELVVPEGSKISGKRLYEIEMAIDGDVLVAGHVNKDQRFTAPSAYRTVQDGDRLIIKAGAEELHKLLEATGLELAASQALTEADLSSDDVVVMEAIVQPQGTIVNRSAKRLNLRSRYGVNLLGVAREGGRLHQSPESIHLRAGDVLLLQGSEETLYEVLPVLGCLPLAERGLRLGKTNRLYLALIIFVSAIIAAALGWFPVQIAFAWAALFLVLARYVSLKEIYESIDWPIIVLLGAMIPVSQTLETSGAADTIAGNILQISGSQPAWVLVGLLMIAAMLLSNIVNNAAAVLIMAPIALRVAEELGVNQDPFLMAVALGASCAFLTPIGHQSSTLVMGPGGYRFGDYWRLGLPLQIVVLAVGLPLLLRVWPI